MSSLQLPGQLHQIVTFSANSQIYLGRQKYLKITQDLVQQWLRHHHLESIDIDLWQQFIHQEWPKHLTAAKFGVSWKHIKDIQQKTQGFVLHCIDHRPFEAWIFCPLLYHQLLMKTFQDQTTYTPLRVPPVGLPDFCSGLVPTTLLKRYPWGFRTKSFRVANAYILAKHKKDFTTARSIVAYHATIAAPILATTSWLLIDISKQVFSKAFGDRTVYQIWKQIHSAMDAPFQFQSHNDDLVGFFTSLPQQRILEDVQDMIQRYCRSNRLDIATAVMSVPSRTHKYHQPSIQGKVSFADQPMVKNTTKTCAWHCQNELWPWHFPRGWTFFPSDPWHSHRKSDLPSTFRYIGVQNWTWLGLPTPNRIETHHSCTLRWQSVYIGACAHFDRTRFAPRFSTIMWQRFLHPTSWAWTCQRSRRIPWI